MAQMFEIWSGDVMAAKSHVVLRGAASVTLIPDLPRPGDPTLNIRRVRQGHHVNHDSIFKHILRGETLYVDHRQALPRMRMLTECSCKLPCHRTCDPVVSVKENQYRSPVQNDYA